MCTLLHHVGVLFDLQIFGLCVFHSWCHNVMFCCVFESKFCRCLLYSESGSWGKRWSRLFCKIGVLWQWLLLLSPGVWSYVVWISWSTLMIICGEILWNVCILLPHFVALCLSIPQPPGIFVLFLIGGSIFVLDFKYDFHWYRLGSNMCSVIALCFICGNIQL